jgi:glyoxylase-like metal-dependent hydrolase (beta-lactamase superfamily II)/ferredoxin
MANPTLSHSDNVPGQFFVDTTCIDCDLCRQIAPTVFSEGSDHSFVSSQPGTPEETHRAAMALVACPTGSIGTAQKIDLSSAVDAYPERVDENVYFCGFASEKSYGSASYLILRPEGNVLVDSPRYASRLVRRIETFGGVSTMFLTHRDDVADHDKFHGKFGCHRIIHRADARGLQVEQLLEGSDPVQLSPDLLAIPVPGHTRGHVVLLYRDKFLFTGDHLAWSDRSSRLVAFRSVTWYSWREQTESMKRLLNYGFEWVLPGHGRRARRPPAVMRQRLEECVEWMSKVS